MYDYFEINTLYNKHGVDSDKKDGVPQGSVVGLVLFAI
jgi:hypothetical protein